MQSSRFIISARSQAGLSLCFSPDRAAGKAHAKWLLNGATTQGAVKAGFTELRLKGATTLTMSEALRYDRYRFFARPQVGLTMG